MISPNMVVDDLTWREATGPGTTYVYTNNNKKSNLKAINLCPYLLYDRCKHTL